MTLLPACGGSAEDDPSGSGGEKSGNGAACSDYENDQGRQLDVVIRNERSTPIHLGPRIETCGNFPLFEVQRDDGTVIGPPGPRCSGLCADFIAGNQLGCVDICVLPTIATLQPGESHTTSWNTLYLDSVALPSECNGVAEEEITCPRLVAIEPGRFTFKASAGTELECAAPNCPDCSDEECTFQKIVAGEELSSEVTLELDSAYGIHPSDDESVQDGASANGSVEIVFVD